MIYPKIPLENWFECFPRLQDALPLMCLCGEENVVFKPYLTKNSIGIESQDCACGRKGSLVFIDKAPDYRTF